MNRTFSRRMFLGGVFGIATAMLLPAVARADIVTFNFLKKRPTDFPYKLTDAQWRQKLGPDAYTVMRLGENERAGSSPLLRERRKGTYDCRGCGQPLFSSSAKMRANDWPTFSAPLNVKTLGIARDFGIVLPRTEVYCNNCGGHLGYKMQDDPPPPSGLRYMISGAALAFRPA